MTSFPSSQELLNLFNSLKNPVVFTDCEHMIRYMNRAAINHYKEGESLVGTNLLDCHNPESQSLILEIFEEMKKGLEERLITDNEKYRIYMRAIRDNEGNLVGYYERYEPPVK